MFMKEDNTYNDIREKSLLQWLAEMEQENALKNNYLKKLSKRE